MMGSGGSIQLMRVFGIRIGVNPSWFLVLFIFIFWLSGSFRATLNSSDTTAYAIAVAAALLFFVSLILHELGHALVAKRNGIDIAGIDLWFFGGVARMSRDTDSPGVEFRVSAAGPLVTLLIVAVCFGIGAILVGPQDFLDSARLQNDAASSPRRLARVLPGLDQRARVPVQPDPGVPARRRPHRPGDRVEGDRRPLQGDEGRRAAWVRSSRGSSWASAWSGFSPWAR